MREDIYMPFFSINNGKLNYLNKFTICELPKEENIQRKILKQYGAILERNINTNKKATKNVLVIEPHPDDFALSAMGYIQNDMNVTVLNIFSCMKIESFTWNGHISINEKEYEDLRLLESKIAIEEILDYNFISLKEKSTKITEKPLKEIQKNIIYNIEKLISEKHLDILMIPMGIGEHQDHILVYNAITNEYSKLNSKVEIIFYPEYPYARCKKSYIDRLNDIKKRFELSEIVTNIENKLEGIVNAISVYKSQHDDINKEQMLAIVREDGRAIATEYGKENISLVYYKIDRRK